VPGQPVEDGSRLLRVVGRGHLDARLDHHVGEAERAVGAAGERAARGAAVVDHYQVFAARLGEERQHGAGFGRADQHLLRRPAVRLAAEVGRRRHLELGQALGVEPRAPIAPPVQFGREQPALCANAHGRPPFVRGEATSGPRQRERIS
jgi:hypothetical protein